ncbi:MAG: hypothetical protein AAFZ17_14665 [Cyanobacteria bacterium J06650_10]
MNWLTHHTLSENYAAQAVELIRNREMDRAVELYLLATEAES